DHADLFAAGKLHGGNASDRPAKDGPDGESIDQPEQTVPPLSVAGRAANQVHHRPKEVLEDFQLNRRGLAFVAEPEPLGEQVVLEDGDDFVGILAALNV